MPLSRSRAFNRSSRAPSNRNLLSQTPYKPVNKKTRAPCEGNHYIVQLFSRGNGARDAGGCVSVAAVDAPVDGEARALLLHLLRQEKLKGSRRQQHSNSITRLTHRVIGKVSTHPKVQQRPEARLEALQQPRHVPLVRFPGLDCRPGTTSTCTHQHHSHGQHTLLTAARTLQRQ